MPAGEVSQRFWRSPTTDNVLVQVPVAYLTGTPLKQFSGVQPTSAKNRKNSNVSLSQEIACTNGGGGQQQKANKPSSTKGPSPSPRNQQQQQIMMTPCNPKYKTEMCRSVYAKVACKYGDICQFAHSEEELRNRLHNMKYKTVLCKNFHMLGFCYYGKKCDFRHNEALPDDATSGGGSETSSVNENQGLNVSTGGSNFWPTNGANSSTGSFGGSDGDSPVPSSLSDCDSSNHSGSPDLPDDFLFAAGNIHNGNVVARPSSYDYPLPMMTKLALGSDDQRLWFQQNPVNVSCVNRCLPYHAGGNSFMVKYPLK